MLSDSTSPAQRNPAAGWRIGLLSTVLIAAFVVFVVFWLLWDPAAVKAVWARHCAGEARKAMEAGDMRRATEQAVAARRWAPEDPEVMRLIIEFLKVSSSDPAGLVQQLRALSQKERLTEAEQMLLGSTLARMGRTDEARKVYDALPLHVSTQKAGLQLFSIILSQEGHNDEARALNRRAILDEPVTPEARLKAALEDRDSGFHELRLHAHKELLALAELKSDVAMEAAANLSIDSLLTASEARRLLDLVSQHPRKNFPLRLGLLSALMRLEPSQAESVMLAEIKNFKTEDNDSLLHLARWLALEKKHDLLSKLVPPHIAYKSRELYPILAQSLAEEGRWDDLRHMLTSSRPPVPQARVAIWLAEASSHLSPDMKEAARLLEGSIATAAKTKDLGLLVSAAEVAERIKLPELAFAACQAAAEQGGEGVMQPMLEKALEMALVSKDSAALLSAARQLHVIRPASVAYADRLAYLRLVLGVEIEMVRLQSASSGSSLQAAFSVAIERVPPALLKALAAYRLGDLEGVKTHLSALSNPSALPAGQRAVAAGLLALAGKPDRAWQIAEKVPDALLLNEELAFLKHAR